MAGRAQRSHQSSVVSRQSSVVSRQSRETRESRESRAPGPEQRATNLDRVIHERMRLAIVSALAVNATLTFNDLKRLLGTTDGNLSVHARKLEDARYITCEKSFEGRMPKTEYRLTAAGRKAFEKYLSHMESLIKAVRD
jgi:DNA-binding HxlR family transcriptional regulator